MDIPSRWRSRLMALPWPMLALASAFVAAAGLKLYILPMARMPFDSDEAILLLMARHILQGERPLFFYGEAYGGSFDSFLTAFFYRFLGDTVVVGRLVQSLEYLLGMVFTYLLARRLMPGARLGPLAALWLMAVPPLLMSTWTTPSVLYVIAIWFGSILLYLGHRLLREDADRPWCWAIFGAVAGLSFWTFGLIVVYMLPFAVFFLWQFRWRRWPGYLLATIAFFLFSLPWWMEALAGFQVLYNSGPGGVPPLSFRLFSFLGLTLPSLFGFREPWTTEVIFWPVLAVPILIFYLAAILFAVRRLSGRLLGRGDPAVPAFDTLGFTLLGMQALAWALLYFGTRFSLDATGRYILPLYSALFIVAGLLLERVAAWHRPAAIGLLAALVAFNLAAHIKAVQVVPPGITAQMNPALQFGNASDQALIDFVAAHGGRGYSHHWISYKIAFLSNDQVILAAYLPFRADLYWNPLDDRYPPYAAAVAASSRPVYVTHREPNLETYLQRAFAERQVTYSIQDIGPYRVYYDLSEAVSPQEIGLGPGQKLQ